MKILITCISFTFFSCCVFSQEKILPSNMEKIKIGKKLRVFPKAYEALKEISKKIAINKNASPCWYNDEITKNIIALIDKFPDSRSALTAQLLLLKIYAEEAQTSELYIDKKLKNIYLGQIKTIAEEIQQNHKETWEAYFAANSELRLLCIAGKEKEIQKILKKDLHSKKINYYNQLYNSIKDDPYYSCYAVSIDRKFKKNFAIVKLQAIMEFSKMQEDIVAYDKAKKLLKEQISFQKK